MNNIGLKFYNYLQHHRDGIEHPKWCNLDLLVDDGYAPPKRWWSGASEFDGRVELQNRGRIAAGKVLRCWTEGYCATVLIHRGGSAFSASSVSRIETDNCQPDEWRFPLIALSEDSDGFEEQVAAVVAVSNQPAPLLRPLVHEITSLLVLVLKLPGLVPPAPFYDRSVSPVVRRGLFHQLLVISFEIIKERTRY